jgi:hypothetical protein
MLSAHIQGLAFSIPIPEFREKSQFTTTDQSSATTSFPRRQNAYPANEDEKAVRALGPGFRPALWAGGAFQVNIY